jgi:putative transposase
MLTVLDEYSREALCVNVVTTMGSAEVLEALYPLLLSRGKPEYLRSDNGPEFSSAPFKAWLLRVGIQPIQIYPAAPCSRHATANSRNNLSEPPNHWH